MLIPREADPKWSVAAGDGFTPAQWERVERYVGDSPSTLRFLVPEFRFGDDGRIGEVRENMYAALEAEWFDKLARGFVLVERNTGKGVRYGIVACLDLEQYASARGESAPVRPAEETDPACMRGYLAARRECPLEFPFTTVLYKDKKCKVVRTLLKCELELLYDQELMDGGSVKGYFIPADMAAEVAADLHTRGEPCFLVADGNDAVAAAKAYWEEIKGELSPLERENHPARFTLAEFMNVYEEGVELCPVCRVVEDTDAAALCATLRGQFKCKIEQNVVRIQFADLLRGLTELDGCLSDFVKKAGGRVVRTDGEAALHSADGDSVAIVYSAPDKSDVFDAVKNGRLFPKGTFTVGRGAARRFVTEGREISYD